MRAHKNELIYIALVFLVVLSLGIIHAFWFAFFEEKVSFFNALFLTETKEKQMIEEYQCPGCVDGPYPECYEHDPNESSITCTRHISGSLLMGASKILLGLPRGFNRIGGGVDMNLFEKFSEGWGYNQYNIPVWKTLDTNGNTLVRGLSPRINRAFLHVFKGDCMAEISCLDITPHLKGMD